jgi:hypothetical protein
MARSSSARQQELFKRRGEKRYRKPRAKAKACERVVFDWAGKFCKVAAKQRKKNWDGRAVFEERCFTQAVKALRAAGGCK